MTFEDSLAIIGDLAVFDTGLLLAGDVDPNDVRRQLSRWTKAGKLHQLRRGVYAVAPPFRKIKPHPFAVANQLVAGSYVSCESALAHYGLIPDVVAVVVSVAVTRPARWSTALGDYAFHHVKRDLVFGYRRLELGGGQSAFVATPEKALLDLVHLKPGGDGLAYLRELRLQNLEGIDVEKLRALAKRTDSPKLRRAAEGVAALASAEAAEFETL